MWQFLFVGVIMLLEWFEEPYLAQKLINAMHRLLEVLGAKIWQGANFWPKFPSKSRPGVTIDLNEAQFSHKLWQIGGFCCS